MRRRSYTLISLLLAACEPATGPNRLAAPGAQGADLAIEPLAMPASAGIIAFTSTRNGDAEVFLMNADGSSQVRLVQSSGVDFLPSLSPDGRRVAFVSTRDGNHEVYVINVDGTGLANLTQNSGMEDDFPSWSPDGTRLVYTSYVVGTTNSSQAYVMNADGSSPTPITSLNYGVGQTSWAPGPQILLSTQHDSQWEIYAVNADGTGLTRLTDDPGPDQQPRWSPDGTRIAYIHVPHNEFDWEIYVMQADGSNPTRITNSSEDDLAPVWSPDGTKLAFASERDGNQEIYRMNPDGSSVTRLTSNPAVDYPWSWAQKVVPLTTAECMNGGWASYFFKNQGQCLALYNLNK